ncbi:MAG TPA: FAD-dependent oxidoreductase [Actinophytocola sp.]|nr:FAD-dependent oxidoreductase [Actinophytocola sp.]
MTAERIVIVGADAAGMSAAHQALRTAATRGRELAITVLDKGRHTSYSACGIPYWMAGDVESGASLVARTAEQHRAAGIDLRLGTAATGVDLAGRRVTTDSGETLEFDQLVIASGAHPVVPAWALHADGTPYDRVGAVHTLDDGAAWLERFEAAEPGAHMVIVGGGYVGIEVAETALRRGFGVTVLTRSRVLSSLEPEMSERVALAMCETGIEVVLDAEVTGFDVEEDEVVGVHWTGGSRPCDLVVLALGVQPSTGFLADSGIPLGHQGALSPDSRGHVIERVWAAGDCCDSVRRLTGDRQYRPLGTHANKLGRALGENLAGGRLTFDGILETAITRFAAGGQYLEIARTGLSREDAEAAAFDPVALVTEGTTASGYLPEAEPIALWVMADRVTRRLLGVQVVGGHGAGKRIDAAAAVLWAGGSVDDLAWMDLSYAPPFSTAWEVLQVAARRVAERL